MGNTEKHGTTIAVRDPRASAADKASRQAAGKLPSDGRAAVAVEQCTGPGES